MLQLSHDGFDDGICIAPKPRNSPSKRRAPICNRSILENAPAHCTLEKLDPAVDLVHVHLQAKEDRLTNEPTSNGFPPEPALTLVSHVSFAAPEQRRRVQGVRLLRAVLWQIVDDIEDQGGTSVVPKTASRSSRLQSSSQCQSQRAQSELRGLAESCLIVFRQRRGDFHPGQKWQN